MKKFILLFCGLFIFCCANAQTRGNMFLISENYNTHSFQLNIGYNAIYKNSDALYHDIVGLPIGFAYQFNKNDFLYFKIKYINLAMHTFDVGGLTDRNRYGGRPYHLKSSDSQHLIAATIGLMNATNERHVFQAGVSVGLLAWMYNEDYAWTYYEHVVTEESEYDVLKDGKENVSGSSGDMYVGLDLAYKYYLTNNIFIGAEGNFGYLFDFEKTAYGIQFAIGYTFTKKKNFLF